jgi:sulfate permease, SulP family
VDLRGLNDLQRKSPREWILALVTAASVVLFGVEDGILLALVLSLLQHVRHSYKPPVAVETQMADGHWQMRAVEPGLLKFEPQTYEHAQRANSRQIQTIDVVGEMRRQP